MLVDEFDFELPERLIAQTPLPDRAASRLLALNRATGETEHARFGDIVRYLRAGDVLVLNDTRVIPARLIGVKRGTGARAEFLLLKPLGGDRWEALVRPGKRLRPGAVVDFGAEPGQPPLLSGHIEDEGEAGLRTIRFEYRGIFQELLDRLGSMPLPPYIKAKLEDKERYQTVYAVHPGSAAAPTAGLHFTPELLEEIAAAGVETVFVTLHVGLGTFRPVTAERVEEHRMHAEFYRIGSEAAERINEAKRRGGRVIAVGTTSCRALESAAEEGRVRPGDGWTDIFIYPGYRFRIIDALLTNFHLPKSTLLMLVSAFAGKDRILRAYREAIEREYRFFSFGDAMFIHSG